MFGRKKPEFSIEKLRLIESPAEIGHLEKNCDALLAALPPIRQMVESKKQAAHELLREAAKHPSEVSREELATRMNGLRAIEARLTPLLEKMNAEALRLQVRETNELESEDAAANQRMAEVDRTARAMAAELVVLQRIADAFADDIIAVEGYGKKLPETSKAGASPRP